MLLLALLNTTLQSKYNRVRQDKAFIYLGCIIIEEMNRVYRTDDTYDDDNTSAPP